MGGFVRLRADEVLSHTGKYPKGAGGGQRVHVSWPPPDPPLLSYSAPLASQGRAQLGSRPSLGGPLSPLAQLIPPPAPRCRSILGVSARGCHGRSTLQRYVPRHRGHARCVPVAAPDWLLAQGQTKWRARYGPCRSRDKRKYHSCAAFPSLHNRCCKKFAPFLARRAWKGAMIIRFFGESPVGVPRYRCAARLRARRFFFCPACHTTSTMSSTVPT